MTELTAMTDFHLIRPEWLWALLPVILLLIGKLFIHQQSQWQNILPAHLASALLGANKQGSGKKWPWLLTIIWLVTVVALAGPSWEKIEKPVYKVNRASVIVLDMSMSMRATDLAPNRLTKARYKTIDLAKSIADGEIALVAYAGDAFVISPLTDDVRNITNLIPSLEPEIMPESGSYPLLGLEKATELLQQGGYPNGDIFWITDGIDREDEKDLSDFFLSTPYRIHTLVVGSQDGAPIKLKDGTLLKDHAGTIVLPKTNLNQLYRLSNKGSGSIATISADDTDIERLISDIGQVDKQNNQDKSALESGDDWHEFGPTLLLIALLALLPAFRKGAAVLTLLVIPTLLISPPTVANTPATQANKTTDGASEQTTKAQANTTWRDYVFETPNQVASKLFNQGQYNQAQQVFEDKQWQAASAYKNKDYQRALELYSNDNSESGLYNQGNSLAQLGELDKAIEKYQQVLQANPDHTSALANKQLLEQLKQQQQQQQQQQQNNNQDQQQENNQQQEQQQNQDSDSQQNSQGQQQSQQQSEQQSQQANSQDSNDNNSDPDAENASQQSQQQKQDQQQSKEQQQAQQQSEQQGEQDKTKQQQAAQLNGQQQASQEQQQKLQQLLRKVNDDPSVLLRNKMILEHRKRQQLNRRPTPSKTW